MLNNKYSKVLTIILIVAIIIIVGLLVFLGIDWYKAYTIGKDNQDFIDQQLNSYLQNQIQENAQNMQNTQNIENIENNTINNIIEEPNNIVEEPTENTNNGGSTTAPTYKGMKVAGFIEIPKTNVKYNILDDPSAKAMEVAITIIYGPGINQGGNTILAGHNYRNGTFFSNNNKLSEGDKIYLTDLSGKKITYTIYKKYKTDANDFSYATRETNGKREISLTTCTDDSSARIIIWAKEN